MSLIQEVISFSRDYVNSFKSRTKERKTKIRKAYYLLTGTHVNKSCGFCYIEAILTIIKLNGMAQCNYLLKPGVLLQAFSDESKTCTNANLTDELAEWHLQNNPGIERYFSKIKPGAPPPLVAPAGIKIVPTPEPVIIQPDKIIEPVSIKVTEAPVKRKLRTRKAHK